MDYPEHANSAKNAALFIQITYPCATRATVNLIWTCQEANFTGHAHDFKLFGPKAILDSKLMLFKICIRLIEKIFVRSKKFITKFYLLTLDTVGISRNLFFSVGGRD